MTLALLALMLIASTDDWPQFRGPNGTGVAADTGLPVEVGPEKNVAWKTPMLPGYSSPVLAGSRIFLTGYQGESVFTIGLERATGKILWKKEVPRPRREPMHAPNTPANPSPATDGESVFVFFGDFGIISYTLDGNERWRLPLGPFNNQNGHGSSPVVFGDSVFLICDQDTDSYVVAVDKKSGRIKWKTERPGATRGFGTPAIFKPASGAEQLVVPGSFQIAGYDLKTGAKIWWVDKIAWQVKGVPLIAGDTIYMNTWETFGDVETPPQIDPWETTLAKYDANHDGILTLEEMKPLWKGNSNDFDLNKNGTVEPAEWENYIRIKNAINNLVAFKPVGRGDLTDKVMWRYRKLLPNIPSPVMAGGALFLIKDGGLLTTLDPATGEVLKQGRVTGALDKYWASPVAADGKVFLLDQSCKLSAIRAQPQWEVLHISDLDDECFATPAIGDHSLYVRTKSWLYCFREPLQRLSQSLFQ